ncbi:uncharacterized protein LOC144915007 [Branchiostoma floridae x Branchiostoma belcheri]
MKSQADVWPVAFTVTASLGDPVTLQMVQKSNRTGPLEWRRGGVGGTVLTGQNSTNLTIASARSSDEGIYECYYQGDTERKQGIMRLIVRDCAENKWSPPSCGADCPVCYNGGVCDDNTGECVCPPGFYGQNCESACMHDKIGTSCTRECDGGNCTGQLLCVMDPYGCSCAPGLMGIECNTECPDGMYEAGCTQTCHCAEGPTACDKKTGACAGGCLDFWTGDSCQIRTVAVSYEDLFSKEEGHFFFGSSSDHITAYSDIDKYECARRCLEGYDSYDGVNPKCLSFNHLPAGSPEGVSARCWLSSSDKDTAASPGPEWDSWPYRNYYQRKHILAPQDCTDILALGIRHVYTVGNPQPFQAYCDMDTDGGSWTVIQRRQDGSVQFNRTWTEYEQGFGNTSGEYWLGLKNIHSLTTQKQSELYVYLEDWVTNSRFARYSTFSVGDASSKYTATIDGYNGTATDSLDPSTKDGRHSINNRPFSTTDQDNDGVSTDCAGTYGQGGWWYTPSCGYALLNGQYLTGCSVPSASCSSANGIVWYTWLGYRYSLRKTVMMVRSTNVSASPFKNCQHGGTLTPGPEDSGLYICACAEGWNGVFCDQECSGTYGPDCGITCGHCYGNQTCDRFTGKCPTGEAFVCAGGYYGDKCDRDCPHGLYGGDCTQTCHCTNGSDCNKTTGVCNGECVDFWTGETCQNRTGTVSYGDLFTKEGGRFFGDSPYNHITTYSNIDADECARRCLQGNGSYHGVNSTCLSFNHRPAGSPEGASARCWLSSSDKDTAASPGPEWDSWPYRNYYQRKQILAPQDCTDILALGIRHSHVYTIGHPQPFQAYCDMDTDGGGWTVIQRRQDGSVPFDKTWTEYEQGFGNPTVEYWLGLGNIHSLTTQKQNELYVYLEDWETNSRFARYSTFFVGDASSKYTATIEGYNGTATDSLDPSTQDGRHSINNRPFSTTDQDNDGVITDCAGRFGQGGWWYTLSCGYALLNGQYLTGCSVPLAYCSSANGIVWYTWRHYQYSLKKTIMMVRPANFSVSSFRPCQNGGTLTSGPVESGLYICTCAHGWYGAFCDQESPKDVTVSVTTVNSTTLHVTWTVGVSGNISIIDSQVRYKQSDAEGWGAWTSAGASIGDGDVYIYNLRPGAMYDVQVRVNTSLGWSDLSNVRGTTVETPPGPPRNLAAVPTSHNSVHLTWDPPIEPDGKIHNYTVQYGASQHCFEYAFLLEVTTAGDITTTVIGHLDPYTNYAFRVRGSNSAGGSNFSNCNIARTLEYYQPAPVAAIVGGSVSALLVVLLVTIGIVCYRKRKAEDDRDPTDPQIDLTIITENEPSMEESAENPTAIEEDFSPYDTTIYSRPRHC